MIVLGALADLQGPRTAILVSGLTFVALGGALALRRESREFEPAPLAA